MDNLGKRTELRLPTAIQSKASQKVVAALDNLSTSVKDRLSKEYKDYTEINVWFAFMVRLFRVYLVRFTTQLSLHFECKKHMYNYYKS
jgi:hypothetical protein